MEKDNWNIDFPTEIAEEGKIKILVPKLKAFVKSPSDYAPSKAPVFYNPVMELNRDMAVIALQAYQKMVKREISVCEPLAGCGVRGIRLASEVEGVKNVVINDISVKAVQLATYNVEMNKLQDHVSVQNKDANLLLSSYASPRRRFDAVDVDPFGSPVPYMDSALRALRNNGLVALTATDMAPLCGVHPKACIRKYGGKPLRTEYCHELAARLLAGSLVTTAARRDIGIHFLLGYYTDYYIRVYAIIKHGAKAADESIKNMGYILHCFNCFHREPLKKIFVIGHTGKCSECGSKIDVAGPLWLEKLSDNQFLDLMEEEMEQKMLKHKRRIGKILALIKKEVDTAVTYYVVDRFCDKLALPVPSINSVLESLREKGFEASLTHFSSKGIRTNAPAKVVKESLQHA